jgi:hypothetical protein
MLPAEWVRRENVNRSSRDLDRRIIPEGNFIRNADVGPKRRGQKNGPSF